MNSEQLSVNNSQPVGYQEAQMAKYVTYWRQRLVEQRAVDERLARQARADAMHIAIMLRKRYGASRVILFGSLVRNRFTAESDIDLAVKGLAKLDLFPAMADANELAHRWVDLKPLEELDPHFRRRVLETGEDL